MHIFGPNSRLRNWDWEAVICIFTSFPDNSDGWWCKTESTTTRKGKARNERGESDSRVLSLLSILKHLWQCYLPRGEFQQTQHSKSQMVKKETLFSSQTSDSQAITDMEEIASLYTYVHKKGVKFIKPGKTRHLETQILFLLLCSLHNMVCGCVYAILFVYFIELREGHFPLCCSGIQECDGKSWDSAWCFESSLQYPPLGALGGLLIPPPAPPSPTPSWVFRLRYWLGSQVRHKGIGGGKAVSKRESASPKMGLGGRVGVENGCERKIKRERIEFKKKRRKGIRKRDARSRDSKERVGRVGETGHPAAVWNRLRAPSVPSGLFPVFVSRLQCGD